MTVEAPDLEEDRKPESKVLKVFRIVPKVHAKQSRLGPHIVDAAMRKELFISLGEVVPFGPCLFDWKIEHHTVDEFDDACKRWPGAEEGDVVVQGYIRYQIPKGE